MLEEAAESWDQSAKLLLLMWSLSQLPAYDTDSLKSGHFWG